MRYLHTALVEVVMMLDEQWKFDWCGILLTTCARDINIAKVCINHSHTVLDRFTYTL